MVKNINILREQQEADRVFFRHPKRIWKDLCRCKNRIRGCLAFSGIDIPEQYGNAGWCHNFINWLNAIDCKQTTRRNALNYMFGQMEFLRVELLCISTDIRKMMRGQDRRCKKV